MKQNKKINCGILFNAKENNFIKYLSWLYDYSLHNKSINIKIFTNDKDYIKENLSVEDSAISNSFYEVLDFSDLILSLGFWKVIKRDNIDKVPLGIVNFHHSYRLKYRGRHCSTWVLKNNESLHGSTMHYLDEDLDKGSIIDSRSFRIDSSHVAEDLFERANNLGFEMLKENFSSLLNGRIKNSVSLSNNQYMYKKKDLNHEISSRFINDEENFLKHIRSLTFDNKPSPYVILENKKVYLKIDNYDTGILKRKANDKFSK